MSTILVVDDEPAIRDLLGFSLRQEGLQVHLAADGKEGLAIYKANPASIDLVLLDIRMPRMDGPRTLAALQEVDPAARCCFLSGQTCGQSQEALLDLGALHVFEKPIFNLAHFARKVHQLLAKAPAPA